MKLELPDLPFAYDALEPWIDAETMQLHHDKHHRTYTDKLNEALAKHPEIDLPVGELLSDLSRVPEDIRPAVRNHGGGYYNHALFWTMLAGPGAGGGGEPGGGLAGALAESFGDFAKFKEAMSAAATGLFGSGWTWLVLGPDKKLSILPLPNQDTPESQGLKPILALDLWEHAYYLKYRNRRADYITAWWNVINWPGAEASFIALTRG